MVSIIPGLFIICMFVLSECHQETRPPNRLFKYKGKEGYKTKDYAVIYPSMVVEDGRHKSYSVLHLLNKNFKPIQTRGAEKLYYKLPIDGEERILELIPTYKIVSPESVVESHGDKSPIKSKIKRLASKCHFKGSIRGQVNSKAAISTCDGLAGYIQTNGGYYLIEPIEKRYVHIEKPHAHAIYKHYMQSTPEVNCHTGPSCDDKYLRMLKANGTAKAKRGELDEYGQLHIEAMVVLERSVLQYHKDIDLENFILTTFNVAHDLLHDKSLGVNVDLAIVRFIRLDSEEHELNLGSTKSVPKTLDFFSKWQRRMNPKDDSHPNHHDLAILITRLDICADERTCGLLGAAKQGAICDEFNQVILIQENGLRMGFTIAHEIGHAMNLPHDSMIEALHVPSVMSPYITSVLETWSMCSREVLVEFINSGSGACLYDPPTEHSFVMVDVLPGVMFDADFQCREIFGPNSALCMTGVKCDNLVCYIEDKGCVESHMTPADGTRCGENKWCFKGACVEVGERPDSVDGGWGPWGVWSECTRTCGSGVSSQERICDSPSPTGGGKFCLGDHRRFRICSTEPCSLSQPTFRDVQCTEFNEWLYPEDGQIHQWKNYPIHDENPCALYCVNELGSIASLRPRVIDGTTCYRGIRDICINGLCKEIPCDLDLESSAIEDRCGVCGGDGTTCKISRGERIFTCPRESGEKKYFEIPEGSINIKIEELVPSESRVEIRDKSGNNVFLTGDCLGMYTVYGSKAWIGMIRTKQEAISIPGPLGKEISIWVDVLQNTTIRFSYGIKEKQTYKTAFSWDYLDWTVCSSECGPGTQGSIPKCVEKIAGLVDEKYCKDTPKPKEQIRPCEITPCTPKWYVGDWLECSKCPFSVKLRTVKCYRPTGTGEGELDIITDSFCTSPKPKSSDSCSCPLSRAMKKKAEYAHKKEVDANRTIQEDFYKIDALRLTVHTELEANKYPAGLPHPKNANDTSFELDSDAVLKFLNVMQHDFSNNKTKI